jgi:general L-amino acid transport system substrate-binding protein
MRLLSVLLVIFFVCCSITPSGAGSVGERVKARGFVSCGSARRPGLANTDGQGCWTGLNVEVCRGIAAAVREDPAVHQNLQTRVKIQ